MRPVGSGYKGEVDDGARGRLYASYVSQKMARIRDYDPRAYARWSGSAYRQMRLWLPQDRGARILDAGCGHGNILHLLTSRGYTHVEGVDRSPEQVALARRIVDHVECADIFEYLSERDAAYDAVMAFDLIEHFRKPEVLRFLDDVFRALRPGGSLVLQTPNADSPWSSSERYNDFTHEVAFNPHSLEHVLRVAGFVGYEAAETGPVVHGAASAVRWAGWQVIRSALAIWNIAETGTTGSRVFTRVFRARVTRPGDSVETPLT